MRIGMVGPDVWLEESMKRISTDFPDIQFIAFPYKRPIELPTMLVGEQNQCDVFLFMGETARRWTARQITPVVPWLGIPRSPAAFLRILTRAFNEGYPPRFITDYQNKSYFEYALDEAGINPKDSYISIISYSTFTAEGYMEKNAELMIKEFQKGHAAFCATIFSVTYEVLKRNHIPAYYLIPCFEDTRHTVQEIVASLKFHHTNENVVAILSVKIEAPQYISLGAYDSRTITKAKLTAAQQVYDFSYQLSASCIPVGMDEFLIFTTRKTLEAATHQFTQLDLLRTTYEASNLTLSVGIGSGTVVLKAQERARQAMYNAITNGGNCAYFKGEKESLIGPIYWGNAAPVSETPDHLITLAKKTGINFNYLRTMYTMCQHTHRNTFTPSELADAAGIRKRTMNRIILKLMDFGYCIEKGHTFPKQRGRPSRVIEIHFEKHPSLNEEINRDFKNSKFFE